MGKLVKCQIFSLLICLALVLVPCLVLSCFLGFGLLSFIVTVSILILSTIYLVKFSRKQQQQLLTYVDEKAIQNENPMCDSVLENEPDDEKIEQVIENVARDKAAQESEVGFVHEPEDFPSDSDTIDRDSVSSENIELDWVRGNNIVGQNGLVISSGSVSEDDEDGLIEIAIPGSTDHSTCNLSEEEPRQKVLSNNLPDDFLPESFMRQQGLLEIFADVNEVNEEENLIEIDISMGSIKCPRFEIEA